MLDYLDALQLVSRHLHTPEEIVMVYHTYAAVLAHQMAQMAHAHLNMTCLVPV